MNVFKLIINLPIRILVHVSCHDYGEENAFTFIKKIPSNEVGRDRVVRRRCIAPMSEAKVEQMFRRSPPLV